MILTLATNSITRSRSRNGSESVSLLEIPSLAIDKLELRGLNIFASSLAGWTIEDLDQLRDKADKAACPCLVLIEDTPLEFASESEKVCQNAVERVHKLAAAAHRLGCNSLAVSCSGSDTDEIFEETALAVRTAMTAVERLELNLLISSHEGLTNSADRLTDLIKRIGGFRIGSLPSFIHAAKGGDPALELRKLAPYAGAIHASVIKFSKSGEHEGYDLTECVKAIRTVGFSGTLAIEYLGDEDPMVAIEEARDVLRAAIDAELT